MEIERGHVYEVGDGWKFLRVLGCYQEYESFNPDVKGDQYVRVIKVSDSDIDSPSPFRMKRDLFEELALEHHGYGTPEEPSYPNKSHESM